MTDRNADGAGKTTAAGLLAQEIAGELKRLGICQPAARSKRLLTTEQAAEYLGVDTETVKRLRAAGKLRSVGLLERKLLFDVDDLDAVIEDLKE